MAANDARPIPRKNAAFRVYFGFRDNTGAPITGGITGADSEVSIDGGAFADATAEFTEIGTTGRGFLDLTAAEMNGDAIYVRASCTNANSRDVDIVLYPEENGDVRVNVTAFNGADLNGNGPIPDLGIADQGTAQSATSTTAVLRAGASFGDDTLIGCILAVNGSDQGYWQFRAITDYVGSTDTATVDAWAVTPTGTITYKVFGTAPVSGGGGGGLDAAGVRAAIGLASANLDTQLSTIDSVVDAIEVDTQNIQSRIPAALVSGRIDASVGAMAANVMTAAAAASDLTTELQSGLATSSALATVAGYIDTEIASILSDLATVLTRLSATRAGYLDNLSGGAVATAAALATVDSVVDAIEVDTQNIQSRLPAALDNGHIPASIKRVGTTELTAAGTGGQGYGA